MAAPSFGDLYNEIFQRLGSLEQRISNPLVVNQSSFSSITVSNGGYSVVIKPTLPSSPTSLSVSPGHYYDKTFADVSWPSSNEASCYEVEVSKKNGASYELKTSHRTFSNTLRIPNLDAESVYGFRVFAVSNIGSYSNPFPSVGYVDINTGSDSTLPPAINNLVVARGATSVIIKFDPLTSIQAPDVANAKGLYQVQISSSSTFAAIDRETTTSSFVVAFSDMVEQSNYWARVRAIDSSGNAGPWTQSNSSVIAGGVNDSMIVADLSAAKIQFGTMSGDRISANTLDAASIKTSDLTTANITLSGGQLIAGSPPSNGLVVNSQGIRLYSGNKVSVALDALTGSASFSGTISASTINGSVINGTNINGGVITGGKFTTLGDAYTTLRFGDHGFQDLDSDLVWDINTGTARTASVISTDANPSGQCRLIIQGPKFLSGADYTVPNFAGPTIIMRSNSSASATDHFMQIIGASGAQFYMDTNSSYMRHLTSTQIYTNSLNNLSGSTSTTTIRGSGGAYIQANASQAVMSGDPDTYIIAGATSVYMQANSSNFVNVSSSELVLGGGNWVTFSNGGVSISQVRYSGGYCDFRMYSLFPTSSDSLLRWGSSGQIFRDASSLRYKSSIRSFHDDFDLAGIDKLDPISYREMDYETKKLKPRRLAGYAAEEVHDIYPNFTVYDEEGIPEGLLYDKMVVLALEGVRDLRKRVKEIEEIGKRS